MPSILLEALPGVHGTVAGIGVAFLSAFLIQAQQKIYEIEDRLDALLDEMKVYASPEFQFQSGDLQILDCDGRIDWEKVKFLLRGIRDSCLRVGDGWRFEVLSLKEQEVICETLASILFRIHVSYPFNAVSMISSPQSEKYNFESFSDEQRAVILKDRVAYLSFMWQGVQEGVFVLAERVSEGERRRSQDEVERRVEEARASYGDAAEWDENRVRNFHQGMVREPTDYAGMILSGFKGIISFGAKYAAAYDEVIEVRRRVSERYRFKSIAMSFLIGLLLVVGFGIIVPLLLLELEVNLDRPIPKWTPYFVLLVSVVPYGIGWVKAYRWVVGMRED